MVQFPAESMNGAAGTSSDDEYGIQGTYQGEDGEPSPDTAADTAAAADEKARKNRLPEIPVPEVAVITCREDLDRVLEAHQRWIAGVLNPNVEVSTGRANLRDADLRGYDLSGVNLSGANLAGANLQEVNLERANLTVTNLTGATLAGANLSGAKLTRTKITGADMRGVDFTGALLIGVDLTLALIKSPEAPIRDASPVNSEESCPVPVEESSDAPAEQAVVSEWDASPKPPGRDSAL